MSDNANDAWMEQLRGLLRGPLIETDHPTPVRLTTTDTYGGHRERPANLD